MSLDAFKEALKPCKTRLSSVTSHYSGFHSQQFDSSTATRKPPKSSISRQLLSLEEDDSVIEHLLSAPCGANSNCGCEQEGDNNGGQENKENNGVREIKLEPFDHTGPYEPLLLSLPGELPAVQVPTSINCRLLEHQRKGVKFLYKLYKKNHGGVLGDDMGLGKTIQAIAFLAAVYSKGSEQNINPHKGEQVNKKGPVLIIWPISVILNWEHEFCKWSTFSVSVYHFANSDLILEKLAVDGVEILITSFDTYRLQGSTLSDIPWEIVIVDEAHKLKNEKSKLYTECLKIRTLKRYGLTGTVMQNKIMELFNLFDWVVPGGLGTREHFCGFYDEPLKHGQIKCLTEICHNC